MALILNHKFYVVDPSHFEKDGSAHLLNAADPTGPQNLSHSTSRAARTLELVLPESLVVTSCGKAK